MKYLLFILAGFLLFSCADKNKRSLEAEIDVIENNLPRPVQIKYSAMVTYNIADRMEHYKVPGVSIAVVKEGKLRWAKGYGTANTNDNSPVTVNTLFQAGSISKPIAALAALKLLEERKVNLDLDVNQYLKTWKVPENKFTENEKVTLRRLLTHTAGMTVHGFPGYKQTDTFPTIEMVLNGEGNTAPIIVDTVPGSIWRYSGGGYTVMEKVIEDVTGLPLEEYMAKNVLPQMGMINSTYEQPLRKNLYNIASAAYNTKGEIVDGLWHNYPEKAAAGLWTTPTDLANYCMKVQKILAGEKDELLTKATIESMLTKYKNNWGLGLSLKGEGDSLIFSHGGKNEGFTNDFESYAYLGNAVIVMTNADNGGSLISEILMSVSSYYGWNIGHPQVVEIISVPADKLGQFVGKYKLNFQVPEVGGDYYVEVSLQNNSLKVFDPNTEEELTILPMEEWKFVDINNGNKVSFQSPEADKKAVLLWNGNYHFDKVD